MAHIGSSYVTTIERLEHGVLALRGHMPDLAKIKRRVGYIGMGHFGNDLWPRFVKREMGGEDVFRAILR